MPSSLSRPILIDRLGDVGLVPDTERYDQHLICDPAVVDLLIDRADLRPEDVALDAGAGPGTIAAALAPYVRRCLAVELDPRFAPLLAQQSASHPNLEVMVGDLLTVSLRAVNVVVANPPFTRLEALLARLRRTPARTLVLVTSREFLRAVFARPQDPGFSRTSVYAQSDYTAEHLADIPADAFWPPPARPPALIRLTRRPAAPSLRRLADLLSRRPGLRVRDAGAMIGFDWRQSDLRPQARLQSLTNAEIARLTELSEAGLTSGRQPAPDSPSSSTPPTWSTVRSFHSRR